MFLIRLILVATLAIGTRAHAAPADSAHGASEAADVYIVTSRETYAGVSAIAREAVPVMSRSGTALVLTRIGAKDVDVLARYVHEQERRCGGFFAFATRTEAEEFLANDRSADAIAKPMAASYTIDNQPTVNPWLPQVQEPNIRATISTLSAFHNRYYTSTTGRNAALWIRDQWLALANGRSDVEVELFTGCSNCSTQPSVILTVQGSDLADEVVVVGAHLDSVNWTGGQFGDVAARRAPGADDDASGIATISEIIRIALAGNWKPRRTVQFHAYAAEEVGLYGSKAIASRYASQNINVVGMLQLDMTNYKTTAPHDMQIISDHSNLALIAYFKQLFDTYLAPLGMVRRDVACGYGCSDHASWTTYGHPAAMVFEAGRDPTSPSDMADFPYIHTIDDSLANMDNSAEHSVKFAQFGLAFIGELGKTTPLGERIFKSGFEVRRHSG